MGVSEEDHGYFYLHIVDIDMKVAWIINKLQARVQKL